MYIQKCIKGKASLLENHLDIRGLITDKFIIPVTSSAKRSKTLTEKKSSSLLSALETQSSSLATHIFNTREEARNQELIYSTGTSVEKEKARKYLDKRQAAFEELYRLGVQKNILRATKISYEQSTRKR